MAVTWQQHQELRNVRNTLKHFLRLHSSNGSKMPHLSEIPSVKTKGASTEVHRTKWCIKPEATPTHSLSSCSAIPLRLDLQRALIKNVAPLTTAIILARNFEIRSAILDLFLLRYDGKNNGNSNQHTADRVTKEQACKLKGCVGRTSLLVYVPS